MRMEISNIDPKTAERIKIYCIKNKIHKGTWAKKAHESLLNKV